MRQTFIEFLVEKHTKRESKDFEDKFKNLDCTRTDLNDEEKQYCFDQELLDFIDKSYVVNS